MVRVRSQPRSPAGFPLIVYQPRARVAGTQKSPPGPRGSARGAFFRPPKIRCRPFYGCGKFAAAPLFTAPKNSSRGLDRPILRRRGLGQVVGGVALLPTSLLPAGPKDRPRGAVLSSSRGRARSGSETRSAGHLVGVVAPGRGGVESMLTKAGQDQPAARVGRRRAVPFRHHGDCVGHRLDGSESDEVRVTDHEGFLSRRSDGLPFRRQEMSGLMDRGSAMWSRAPAASWRAARTSSHARRSAAARGTPPRYSRTAARSW